MSFSEKDFTGCLFNPLVKKGMVQVYPKLNEIVTQDDQMEMHSDLIIRYICALYDKRSPLVQQEKDLNHRKSLAAEVAGFDTEMDEEFLTLLYTSKNEMAVRLTMRFLIRFMKDRLWAMIVANESFFWENLDRLMRPATATSDKEQIQAIDIKARIRDETDATHKLLETYYKDFFGDDADLMKASKDKRWTPELVSEMR